MDVGLELRHARERRDLSLARLSSITKISPRVLQAIEAGDASRLPARVYTRAFVKTYAAEVGLDPQETVRRYFDQFEPPPPVEEPSDEHEAKAVPNPIAAPFWREAARLVQGRAGTAAVLGIVALTIVALAAGQRGEPDSRETQGPAAVGTAGVVPAQPAAPAPVATAGASPAGPLHIAIAPTGPCWVQATEGDSRLFATLLKSGDRRTIDASSEVTLRVGDPATFAFTINGKPARVPGGAGQSVTVRISAGNYEQFLAR